MAGDRRKGILDEIEELEAKRRKEKDGKETGRKEKDDLDLDRVWS